MVLRSHLEGPIMRLLSLGVAGLCLLAGLGRSEVPTRPHGPAPVQRQALLRDGMILWEYTVTVYKTVEKEVEEKTPDGGKVKKTVKVAEPVEDKRISQINASKARLSRADG